MRVRDLRDLLARADEDDDVAVAIHPQGEHVLALDAEPQWDRGCMGGSTRRFVIVVDYVLMRDAVRASRAFRRGRFR